MKTIINFISRTVLFLLFVTVFSSCEKENLLINSNVTLSEKEKQEIISSYEEIDKKASEVLLEDGTVEDFEEIILEIQNYPMVEKAWVDGNTLWVKFKSGGIVSWSITTKEIILPYSDEFQISKFISRNEAANKPLNNKACLINQQFGDEDRPYCKAIIGYLNNEFSKNGYEVTIKNGDSASVGFFEKDLSKYGVIFCINHGSYDEVHSITWLLTGDEPVGNIFGELFTKFYVWWNENKISVQKVREKRNERYVTVPFYAISDSFINDRYSTNSFPNSLIYWVACESMKSSSLGEILSKKGVGVTIGWDDTNCLGQATGNQLFQALLGGYSVQKAFQALPEEAKNDYCAVSSGARLKYYPNSGGTMYLVDNDSTSISIYYPKHGETYKERVIDLYGAGNGFTRINNGKVEVNGITTTLTLVGDTTFRQPIVINNGENHIKISCYGELKNGKSSFATTELKIFGDFPNLALFTELRWNTNWSDVDFHLLPPNSSISDLWTNNDCYYANMSTYWGAYLDVDDVDGYGPEHITIPNTPSPGIYTLYIHYYDDHGAGITDAFVSVSANNGNIVSFGPYQLINNAGSNAGDLWAVCTIEYPCGTITPLNQYYYLGGRKSLGRKKK